MAEFVMKLPDVGEGVAEAEIVSWFVEVGQDVKVDQPLVEVVTDKASVEISCPVSGTVSFLVGKPGEVLAVGADLIGIALRADASIAAETGKASPASAPPTESIESRQGPRLPSSSSSKSDAVADKPLVAPAVRRLAKELGIDLTQVVGTGDGGRITRADVESFRGAEATGAESTQLIGVRRKIAERMVASAFTIPHFSYVEEVDVTSVEDLRKELNEYSVGTRSKLTLLPFITRAIQIALRDHPSLNATFDTNRGTITRFRDVHVGIATQTKNGLMVPVVKNIARLTLWQIAEEILRLAQRARDGSASRDELSGSTITISSLGALGGLVTTPIINHPEVAIVGVNKIQIRAVWNGSSFVPRSVMNLSSSFDHRVVDGAVAAAFIQRVKLLLEHPSDLMENL